MSGYNIWVSVSWQLLNSGTGGSSYRGSGLAFDTDFKTIGPHVADKYVALMEPAPQPSTLPVGAEIYYECAPDFTRTTWVYDGGSAAHTTTEANATTCGYTPPLTCDLGTATVVQQPTASGARLTVQLSGTSNGPALYSLDGGAEQLSPLFGQVAPGTHQVRVRDANLAGCERLLTVEVAAPPTQPTQPAAPSGPPEGVDFVAQPLFHVLSSQAAGASVELELWAESAHHQGDYARLVTLRKRADAQGRVSFRLDALLLARLAPWVPLPASPDVASLADPGLTRTCRPNLVNYYVRTTSLAPGPGALPDYQVSGLRVALRGGLPAGWQGTDFFAPVGGLTPWLSWQPTGAGARAAGAKEVVAGQPEWLAWLCPAGAANQGLRVRRAYRMGPDAAPVVDYEPLPVPVGGWGRRLLAVPLGDARAGFARLSVQVETLAGQALSPEATFAFVERSPRTRFLLLTNSLGGVDTLRCEGRLDVTLEASAETVELPPLVAPVAGRPQADQRPLAPAAGRKLRLRTGWLAPAVLRWAQELVLARELWHQAGAELRPLAWPKRTALPMDDEPGARGLVLECDYAFAPTAYAPAPDA